MIILGQKTLQCSSRQLDCLKNPKQDLDFSCQKLFQFMKIIKNLTPKSISTPKIKIFLKFSKDLSPMKMGSCHTIQDGSNIVRRVYWSLECVGSTQGVMFNIVWCVRHVCLPGTPRGWVDKTTWLAIKLFSFSSSDSHYSFLP